MDSSTADTGGSAVLRQQNTGRLLLRAFRAYNSHAVAALRERGHPAIGLAHTSLLIHLDLEGTRVTTLAERAGMTKQAMGQLLVDLERAGYVARSGDPKDRRALLVTLTEAGRRFYEDAYHVQLALEAEYAAILGHDQLLALRTALMTLLEHERAPRTQPSATADPGRIDHVLTRAESWTQSSTGPRHGSNPQDGNSG